ncbi:MAG: GntR family transcriptional regulator [Marinosulfonomonas sp.]|nr:GntR family transcriptional regulator [Marinosulfonomonas sp.]
MSVVGKPEQYKPNTKADDLQRRLRRSLFDGGFAPGQAISIRRIAQEHDISVIPARDALRGLVAEGILVFKDSRTIVVPELDEQRIFDIRFARVNLERELAYRAFANFDAEDLPVLRVIDAKLDRAIETNDTHAYVHGNYAFHFHIYERANSPVILRLVESLWLQYAPSMRMVCTLFGASAIAHDYHRMALAALDCGDRDNFSAAIASDIRQGMDFIADANITKP